MKEAWFENLDNKIIGRRVLCFPRVTSTNDLAWLEISRGASEGTVIFADEQLKGRGRFGRAWFSPPGKGIWASVVLKPKLTPSQMPLMMVIGAIALTELIRNELDLPALIRWPNDVMINNKKVGGIIVETKYLDETSPSMVLGVGFDVNITSDEILPELKQEMTSLMIEKGETIDLHNLARLFLCYLDVWYQKILTGDYASISARWRNLSALIGKRVRLQEKTNYFEGKVTDLDPCAGISLELGSGEVKTFRGENVELLRML